MNDWEKEFDEKFPQRDFCSCYEGDSYDAFPESIAKVKAFISQLIADEREKAVAEYQAKLNDEGLGEDEEFREFCKQWSKLNKQKIKEMMGK